MAKEFFWKKRITEMENKKIFGEGKNVFFGGEEEGEGKHHGDSPLEREKLLWTGGRSDGSKAQKEVLTDLKRSFGKVENPFNHKKDNSSCTL